MRVAEMKVGFVLYYTGRDHIYAVLVDESMPERVYPLGSWAQIYPRLDKFLEALEGGYPPRRRTSLFHEFTHEWGPSLLPPYTDLQDYDVLILIPHRELHSLPLHTIWVEAAGNYLGLDRAISYCSSATLLNHCVAGNVERLFDLSRWTFDPKSGRHQHAIPRPEICFSYGVDIKTGKNEQYKALASLFAKSFKKGEVFSTQPRYSLKATHMKWQAIGVVCHGYGDPANPDFSGLLLDRQLSGLAKVPMLLHRDRVTFFHDLPFKDLPLQVELEPNQVAEILTVAELKVQFKTTAELVALFGCSTGSGHVLSGDDFNSLAYHWLKLGAASVLASLWELDFGFISECLPIFLENWLKKRQPKAFALRQALNAVLRQRPGIEPYEWGVLVLLGDWL